MGGNCRKLLYSPAGNDSAIAVYLVGCGHVVRQTHKVHIIVDSQLAGLEIKGLDTDGTVDILVFHQAGAGSSVGIYQTIDTEVAVMGPFTAISAVQVLCLAVLRNTGVDCVVTPLPDETAAHDVMLLDELPVVFQVAGAVAHGVCIFAHQEGLVRVGVQITLQTLQRRVHIAV